MPLFWIALAFTCGIWAGSWLALPWAAWAGMAAVFPLAAWLLGRARGRIGAAAGWLLRMHAELLLAPVILLSVLPLGALLWTLAQPHPGAGDISAQIGKGTIVVVGVIERPPEWRDGSWRLMVAVQEVQVPGGSGLLGAPFAAAGKLAASVPAERGWRYGDQVRLAGALRLPPENEDYSSRETLAREGIFAEMRYAEADFVAAGRGSPVFQVIYGIRERALAAVGAIFPPPESALLAGILLGDDSQIPGEVANAFKATGTAHIIAISGFNIALLAGLLATAFRRIAGPRWGAALAAVGIGLYTLLVGASASVVRAAVMGGLGLFAGQVGRRQVGLNTLGATAVAMLAFRPAWLWDAGFQLSFLATLGMILYAGPLQAGFVRLAGRWLPAGAAERAAGWVGEYFLFTLAAQVFTLPVQVTQFGQVSLVSLVANPLILPAQPPVMVLGGLAAIAGMIWPPAGQALAWLAWPFVTYTIRMVQALGSLPHAMILTGPVSGWLAVGAILLAVLPALGRDRLAPWIDRLRGAVKPAAALAVLAALTLLVWRGALATLDQRLRLSLVGGETRAALLVQTPGGRTVLVDGGSSADRLSLALGQRLPPFERKIDALVVAGADQDALAALPLVAAQYPPGMVLWLGDVGSSAARVRLWDALAEMDGPAVTPAAVGTGLDLGDGVRLEVLGTALRISWGAFRAVLPLVGEMPEGIGPASLVVLSPEQVEESTAGEWQAALRAQAVVVNGMGEGLSTGRNGWVQVSTDGERMWVEVERK